METKKKSECVFLLFRDVDFHLDNRLFQHHMRDNYRAPKYQPASVSPKYSRPEVGVTSIDLNLLWDETLSYFLLKLNEGKTYF